MGTLAFGVLFAVSALITARLPTHWFVLPSKTKSEEQHEIIQKRAKLALVVACVCLSFFCFLLELTLWWTARWLGR
jgi:tellurite resistance protein TehA-like permease